MRGTLICDLSSPTRASVNDVCHSGWHNPAARKGHPASQTEQEGCIQNCPGASCYHILGIRWKGHIYFAIWIRVGPQNLQFAWSLWIRYLQHYLDFLFLGAPHTDQGEQSLTTALKQVGCPCGKPYYLQYNSAVSIWDRACCTAAGSEIN